MCNAFRFLVLIAVSLPFHAGCDRKADPNTVKIDPAAVPGTYIANHGLGEDVLIVNVDGTYHQYYVSKDGKRFDNMNSWEFENFEGRPGITFKRFISMEVRFESMDPVYAKKYGYQAIPEAAKEHVKISDMAARGGYWHVEIEFDSYRGTLEFCFDPDLDYCYIKR